MTSDDHDDDRTSGTWRASESSIDHAPAATRRVTTVATITSVTDTTWNRVAGLTWAAGSIEAWPAAATTV